jgi:hypothetical protein
VPAGADDIKTACTTGGRDHYRLIFVADFDRQVRNYDLPVGPDGGGELLQMIDRGVVVDPQTETLGDVLGPRVVRRGVSAAQVAALDRQLEEDGLVPAGPDWRPPVGRRLVATQWFWLVAACRDGRFSLAGIADPEGDFDPPGVALGVDQAMRALDTTGVAWPSGRPAIDAHSLAACNVEERQGDRSICFQLQIGENALVGLTGR